MSYTRFAHKIYFVSDVHLSPDREDITQNFLNFLDELKGDALYILGDFFELWIGDDAMTDFHEQIFNALKNASLPIYFMPGNRDFLINKIAAEKSGCILISDPNLINFHGYNILLTHGDSLCLKNKAHIIFRWMTQNKLLQFLFLKLPLKIRRAIAYKIQAISRKNYARRSCECKAIDKNALEKLFIKYPFEYLIHGHTHQPLQEIISFAQDKSNLEAKKITRIVLGDWLEKPSYLTIEFLENSLKFNPVLL